MDELEGTFFFGEVEDEEEERDFEDGKDRELLRDDGDGRLTLAPDGTADARGEFEPVRAIGEEALGGFGSKGRREEGRDDFAVGFERVLKVFEELLLGELDFSLLLDEVVQLGGFCILEKKGRGELQT